MLSFNEFFEYQETALILAEIDIDPKEFAEWVIENKEQLLAEGPLGDFAGWGGKQAMNLAGWGGRKAIDVAKWGGRQAASAVSSSADAGVRKIQRGANNYQQWRDPVSRINDACRALDKVLAAYGDHRVDGVQSVDHVIQRMKKMLIMMKSSINNSNDSGNAPGSNQSSQPQPGY